MPKSKFRTDITALRALAIISVVLFHIDPEIFPGGFLGVDVFFVISGYLITLSVSKEIEAEMFSPKKFFKRRIMRLFPVLYAVLFVVCIFAWFWMLPNALENFGQSVVATIFLGNNVLLYLTSGYWDLASEYKPLLHTWSLGIEEQFYILFALVVRYVGPRNSRFLLLSFFCSLLLYMCSIVLDVFSENFIFYLVPTRIWQFLLGYFVANKLKIKGTNNSDKLLQYSFIVLIFIVTLNYSKDFEILNTLLVCLSTAVILAHRNLNVSRFYSNILIQNIGIKSYSLYLWHFPVFALFRIYSKSIPSTLDYLLLTPLVWLLAHLSYHLIEIRFTGKTQNRYVYSLLGIGAVLAIFGFKVHLSAGYSNRVFDNELAATRSDHTVKSIDHRVYDKLDFFDIEKCNVLLTGDSYSADLIYILDPLIDSDKVELAHATWLPRDIELENKSIFNNSDIIVFAQDEVYNKEYIERVLSTFVDQKIVFVGTKHFGDNLNWLSRKPQSERRNCWQRPNHKFIQIDKKSKLIVPSENYISLLDIACDDYGRIKITNDLGELLSSDRKHLTLAGVEYWRELFIRNNIIDKLLYE
jgi:peptidoglycan/LPS O-acetylase OafA/YrhL